MFAPVYAQAGVAAVATVIANPTLAGLWRADGCAGFDPVQSVTPNQIKPLKCNKHVDLVLI